MNWKKNISTILVVLTLVSTMVSSQYFFYPNLTAYFLFSFLTKILLIYALAVTVGEVKALRFRWNPLLILFMAWIAYVHLHAYWINGAHGNLKIELLLNGFLFFVACALLLSKRHIRLDWVFKSIVAVSIAESIICLSQQLEIIESLNQSFSVTGSQTNPNITAMFLALAMPVLWLELRNAKGNYKRLAMAGILLTGFALMLLMCRTAIIGALIVAFVYLNKKYEFTNLLLASKTRGRTWILLVVSGLAFYVAGKWMYEQKQSSADGRLFIWKVSLQMIADAPVTGYGYGLFDRNYNLHQGLYLDRHDDAALANNASFVRMAYNEIIENAVEGGVFGGLMFVFLIVAAVCFCFYEKAGVDPNLRIVALAGIIAFAFMSMMNFTIQAVPVFAMFVFFLSLVSPKLFIAKNKKESKALIAFVFTFCVIFSAGLLFKTSRLILGFRDHKKSVNLLQQGKATEALDLLQTIGEELEGCESYHVQLGRAFIVVGNYEEALIAFNKAIKFTSNPNIFINMGFCYQQLQEWENAEKKFKQALQIMPGRFLPRYALMKLFYNNNQTNKALAWANSIVDLSPKIPSKEVDFYKARASELIDGQSR